MGCGICGNPAEGDYGLCAECFVLADLAVDTTEDTAAMDNFNDEEDE